MGIASGDATADLLEVLRAHCPDVADETLQIIAEAATGSDAPVGSAMGGAPGWQSMVLGDIPGVTEVLDTISGPVDAVAAVLSFVAGVLDVISKLLISIPDPFRALILAAYEILKDLITDITNTGAYLYFDAPGLTSNVVPLTDLGMEAPDLPKWVAGDRPTAPGTTDGFMQWASRFRQSFDDPGDEARPIFSDGALIEAAFIVATAPQIPDLAKALPLFKSLLDVKAFTSAWDNFADVFPRWPDDPDRSRVRKQSVHPDWRSWKLRDIGPDEYPIRKLEEIPELLKALLLNIDDIIKLIRDLVDAVKDKVKVLQDLVAVLQSVIEAIQALAATGLHILVVATDEGIDGLMTAFLEAENRPNTDEDGEIMQAHAMAGVCLLAGGSQLAGDAVMLWELLGAGRSLEDAEWSLDDDWHALSDQAQAAVADAEALATEAWTGNDSGGSSPTDLGIEGLWENTEDEVEAAFGDEDQAAVAVEEDRDAAVRALEDALARGGPLSPLALAHIEATRRARGRGRRALAEGFGPRPETS